MLTQIFRKCNSVASPTSGVSLSSVLNYLVNNEDVKPFMNKDRGYPLDQTIAFLITFYYSNKIGRIACLYNQAVSYVEFWKTQEIYLDQEFFMTDIAHAFEHIYKHFDKDFDSFYENNENVDFPVPNKSMFTEVIKMTNPSLEEQFLTPTSGVTSKIERALDVFDKFLDAPKNFYNSPAVFQLRKMLTYCVFKFHVPENFITFYQFFDLYDAEMDYKLNTRGDSIESIISVLKSVSSLTRMVISDDAFFIGSRDPMQFIQNVDWLRKYQNKRCHPNDLKIMSGFVSDSVWTQRCQTTYNNMMDINLINQPKNIQLVVSMHMRFLNDLFDKTINGSIKDRVAPMVVGLYGDSGVGKTSFIGPFLSQMIQTSLGYTCETLHSGFQILNGNDQYLSSYNPNRDHVVMFDELGAYKNSDKSSTNVITNSFLEMCSGGTFVLNSAHLEEKGKREFRPLGIIIASNHKDFGLPLLVRHVEAAWNRFSVVCEVRMKEEYQVQNSHGSRRMDIAKLEEARSKLVEEFGERKAREHRDWWPFRIGMAPKGQSGFGNAELTEFPEFITAFKKECSRHASRVKNDSNLKTDSVENYLCPKCREIICSCDELDTVDIYSVQATSGITDFSFEREVLDEVMHSRNEELDSELMSWGTHTKFVLYIFILNIAYYISGILMKIPWFRSWGYRFAKRVYIKVLAIRRLKEAELKCSNFVRVLSNKSREIEDTYYKLFQRDIERKFVSKFFSFVFAVGALGIISAALRSLYVNTKTKEPDPERTSGNITIEPRDYRPANNMSGRLPSKVFLDKRNIWEGSDVDKLLFGRSSSTQYDIFKERVKSNMFLVSYNVGNMSVCHSHLLHIRSGFYLVANHWWQSVKDQTEITVWNFQGMRDVDGKAVSLKNPILRIMKEGIEGKVLKNDLAVLKISGIVPGKDLSRFLLKTPTELSAVDGEVLMMLYTSGKYQSSGFTGRTSEVSYSDLTYKAIIGNSKAASYVGRCGSPLITCINKQVALLGVNVAGHVGTEINIYDSVSLSEFESCVSTFTSDILTPTSGIEDDVLPTKSESLYTLSNRDEVWWGTPGDTGGLLVFGKDPNIPIPRPRSRVFMLPTYDAFFQHFPEEYHHDFSVPNFRSYVDNDGVYHGVYRNMFNDMKHQASNIDYRLLNAAVKSFTFKLCKIEDFKHLEFWDVDHACSGASYNPFCKPLPKLTGAGYPFGKKKIDHMEKSTSELAPEGYVPGDEMRSQIAELIEMYKNGEYGNAVKKCCFKDEPRKLDKVRTRKIRVFACSPMHEMVIHKMYFGSFCSLFMKNFNSTETVGGVNCWSEDWGEIRVRLGKHPNAINGDYKTYDKKASAAILSGAFSVMYRVLDHFLQCGEEKFFSAMMSGICYPIFLVDNTFVQFPGSLASGLFLTFILNNIANSLYIRLAWLMIVGEREFYDDPEYLSRVLDLFNSNVEFAALGDDNTFTVSDEYIKVFNFKSIQKAFKEIGINYTPADKSDNAYGSVSLDGLTIGKRKWVYDTEFSLWKCPIEKQTCGKMITMALREGPLTDKMKIYQSCHSLLFELAQYGRAEYDDAISNLKLVFEDIGYGLSEFKFYTYEQMMDRILKKEIPWERHFLDPVSTDGIRATSSSDFIVVPA